MQRISVAEFQAHPDRYLDGAEPLEVERNGHVVGHYYPCGEARQRRRRDSVARLEQTVERLRAELGLSEDEFERLFDLSQPVPNDLVAPSGEPAPTADAASH